jgi:transcriptional regulator with XRE-family HTH domain
LKKEIIKMRKEMKDLLQRLRQLRGFMGMKQGEFSKYLKMPQNSYSQIETGVNPIKDRHIALICLTFNVNEIWLRTGKGEMFNKTSNDDPLVDDEGKPLTCDESHFLGIYRQLTDPNKKVAKATVNALLNTQFEIKEVNINTMVSSPALSTYPPNNNNETKETPGIGPRLEDGKTS